MYHLGRLLKEKATDAPRDAGLRALTWDYPVEDATRSRIPEAVLRGDSRLDVGGSRARSRTSAS